MANPAPTINQINAFNATQGTTIDFNIIGGTELVRSNRIYIYDLSDNSLICTHLYVSTESIHELPANTDGSILYADGKSSADFVNGAQYYAQIQTFTDIAGTEGGSGLSVAKMFWCLVDPTLTIDAIPSTISTTSYNVSATYNANTNVVSNIIQQYQFSLYSATGSLLQSSGVVVGSGEQQGTSTAYDISYNFSGLSVGSSYYVVVDVTTTQGMSINTQSNTFTVSIDTPTLGEATVVNNACDGYISVTSNLSSEYGGSGSGEIVSFDTDSENVFTKLQVDLDPIQDLHGYDAPWVGGAGKNLIPSLVPMLKAVNVAGVWTDNAYFISGVTFTVNDDGTITVNGTANANIYFNYISSSNPVAIKAGNYVLHKTDNADINLSVAKDGSFLASTNTADRTINLATDSALSAYSHIASGKTISNFILKPMFEYGSTASTWQPYENICPISGWDDVDVSVVGKNLIDSSDLYQNGANRVDIGTQTFDYHTYLKAGTYTFSNNGVGVVYCQLQGSSSTIEIHNQTVQSGTFTITQDGLYAFWIYYWNGISVSDVTNVQLELGTTATEYEPYNGTTYTQDIEATYTPTVQESEVYLFKQTGDVGGDRETIELVGGSVAWNQWVDDIASATKNGITCTHNGDGSCTFNGTSTARAQFFKAVDAKHVNVNDKILICANNLSGTCSGEMGLFFYLLPDDGSSTIYPVLTVFNASGVLNKTAEIKSISKSGTIRGESLVVDFYNSGVTATSLKFIPQMFNLTQMFGSTIADYIYSLEQANAGAGVAWFRKLFPKPYYAYNAGELISVKASSHDTVGKNQLDCTGYRPSAGGLTNTLQNGKLVISGVPTSNYVQVVQTQNITDKLIDGATYTVSQTEHQTYVYPQVMGVKSDGTRSYYLATTQNATFTVDKSVYERYELVVQANTMSAWGSSSRTIETGVQLELGSQATDFEPYTKNEYPLDSDLELRGIPKLVDNKLQYDGDIYSSSGNVQRKYGIVDLGTLNWVYSSSYDLFYAYNQIPQKPNGQGTIPNAVQAKYTLKTFTDLNDDRTIDKALTLYGNTGNVYIDIRDSSANGNATTLKSSLNGVYLVYELDTPTTETADAFEEIQKVTPIYGTEEFVDSRTVPMPVYTKTQYLTRDIYGGTLDVVSGVLTVTHGYVDLGTLAWDKYTNSQKTYFRTTNDVADMKKSTGNGVVQPIKCSQYKSETWTNTLDKVGYDGSICEGWANASYIAIYDDSKTSMTTSDFKTAMNGVQLVYPLATPQTYQLTPQQIQTLVGKNNVWSEQGEISLAYHIPITNLLVKRQDVDDVSGDWLTLYSQPITQASDMDFTFIDFTNQYGKTYKYALVPLLTQTQSGVEVEVEGGYTVSDEVQSIFDGVFIVDSTGSQKCKANVGYGNVDMNQTVGTITPIGAKYPVVITNSKNQYHNGSISGTIVPDDYYFNGNLSRIDMVNKRDELEQFLTNKRAKIIKDWNGKIWLVMIMDNVSCTFNNNYGMGIVNFNTNWVEVGDPTNQQDLQATGLIDVGGV